MLTEMMATAYLAGEDPETQLPGDAREWLSIYRQLLAFNERLAARQDPQPGPGAAPTGTHLAPGRELDQIRERVGFWERRYQELSSALDVDRERGVVFGQGQSYQLSRRERELLFWFVAHPDQFFSPTTLAARAWNEPALSAEQVRSYVVRLRRALKLVGARSRIESRRGQGYRLLMDSDRRDA